MCPCQGRIKGGVQGVQAPPLPQNFQKYFRKCRKRGKKRNKKIKNECRVGGGGGVPLNIFLGLQFFRRN